MKDQRTDYLHNNAVESGAEDNPADYLYSRAKDYYTKEKGLLQAIL